MLHRTWFFCLTKENYFLICLKMQVLLHQSPSKFPFPLGVKLDHSSGDVLSATNGRLLYLTITQLHISSELSNSVSMLDNHVLHTIRLLFICLDISKELLTKSNFFILNPHYDCKDIQIQTRVLMLMIENH